jgi:hypothetical protein
MIDTIVDINHDNEIDFAKAQTNGIVAIIHKASEGATFKDDKYRSRRDAAIGMGSSGEPIIFPARARLTIKSITSWTRDPMGGRQRTR